MKCPICNIDLVMNERQNVEIDYCPKCRGIWLDRGELDKIIEKSAGSTPIQPREGEQYSNHYQEDNHDHHSKHGIFGQSNTHYKKRKESLLCEIFDF